MKINKQLKQEIVDEKKINRKDALRKTGKFAVFSAATMMTLLSTQKASAGSP